VAYINTKIIKVLRYTIMSSPKVIQIPQPRPIRPNPAPTPPANTVCLKDLCPKPRHDFGPSLGKSYYCKDCLYNIWEEEDGYMSG